MCLIDSFFKDTKYFYFFQNCVLVLKLWWQDLRGIGEFILKILILYWRRNLITSISKGIYVTHVNVLTVDFHKCCQAPSEGLIWARPSPVYRTVVLNQGWFLPPLFNPRTFWQCLETFWLSQPGGGLCYCYWHIVGRGQVGLLNF